MGNNIRKRSQIPVDKMLKIFSNVQARSFNGTRVRVVSDRGKQWVVFADLCKVLGYKNPSDQKKRIPAGVKRNIDIGQKSSLATCVNEDGVRYFTMIAEKAGASAFWEWARNTVFTS